MYYATREAAAPTAPVQAPRAGAIRSEPFWETVLVVGIAMMLASNVMEAALTLGAMGKPPQVRLAYLLIYALCALLLIRCRDPFWVVPFRAPLVIAVLAIPPLSILWSVNPIETVERAVTIVGSSLFGVYLGWRFTLGRIVFLLATAMSIIVVLDLAVIFAMPSIGITQSGQWAGVWQGLHGHKNGLGTAGAMTCLFTAYAMTDNRGLKRQLFAGAFAIGALLLVGANSTTALISAMLMGGLAVWARYLQLLPKQIPVLSLIVVFSVFAVGLHVIDSGLIERVLAFFGKGSDLSSRIPLWTILWEFVGHRWWLGYGYEAFWEPGSQALREIESQLYFVPHYSHNGLIETWLNGGLVLVTLVILMIVAAISRATILFVRWRTLAISGLPLIYCGYFMMLNFSESVVLARNNLTWAIFVALAVFTAKWVRFRVL